ncbi:MAG: Hsp20/alpha crystallin family protein [Methylobacter sp.]
MQSKDMETSKKGSELMPDRPSSGDLMSMPFEEFDRFFDDFLSRRWPRMMNWNMMPSSSDSGFPRVDMIDHDNDVEVQAALPGVNKEDVDVTVHNQSITIRTNIKGEKKEEEKGRYFRHEIMRGSFQRTLPLPENVDGDKAQASFMDGILTVKIPKSEKSMRKSIQIN